MISCEFLVHFMLNNCLPCFRVELALLRSARNGICDISVLILLYFRSGNSAVVRNIILADSNIAANVDCNRQHNHVVITIIQRTLYTCIRFMRHISILISPAQLKYMCKHILFIDYFVLSLISVQIT